MDYDDTDDYNDETNDDGNGWSEILGKRIK